MFEDKKPMDYMASINKARRKRNRRPYLKYLAAAAVVCVAAGGIWFGSRMIKESGNSEADTSAEAVPAVDEVTASREAEAESRAAEAQKKREADVQAVVDSYYNLGIVQVSGYLNMRKSPETGAQVVGKLLDGSACQIMEELDGWYHVTSGDIEGYVSSEYVLTGEEAQEKAKSLVTDLAVVLTDNLNIREEPSVDSNVVGQCLEGERYEILDQTDGWYQIPGGYISMDYAEKRFGLNEARKLDLKAMVLNYYDNPGVSNVTNYLNIRDAASESDGKSSESCPAMRAVRFWRSWMAGIRSAPEISRDM